MAAKRRHIMLGLARCGETAWEAEGRLHGRTNLPLSDAGRTAVTTDAWRLRGAAPSTIYHPPDDAAEETAQLIARASGGRTKEFESLAGPNLGLFEGMLTQELAERYPKRFKLWEEDPLTLIPPEGEAIADARGRLLGATAKLLRKSRASEIAVVLHPIAFGLLRCWFGEHRSSELWPVLADRQRLVRYAVAMTVVDRMREAARPETVES